MISDENDKKHIKYFSFNKIRKGANFGQDPKLVWQWLRQNKKEIKKITKINLQTGGQRNEH